MEAQRHLEEQIAAAPTVGGADVMAFGLADCEYRWLVDINDYLRKQGGLESSLKPLAAAVSAELFRRRTGGYGRGDRVEILNSLNGRLRETAIEIIKRGFGDTTSDRHVGRVKDTALARLAPAGLLLGGG